MMASAVDVRPLSPALGGRVTGVDLNDGIDAATFDVLRAAFLEHQVLVFPGQFLRPGPHEVFGDWWGKVSVLPYLAAHAVDGHGAVLRVENVGKDATVTENWHFDSAYFDRPPKLAILAAQVLPDIGGDTMWADQYAAYDALSDRMKDVLDGLQACFAGSVVGDDGVRREVLTPHPIVRVHPDTGRAALAVGRPGPSVPCIEGMTPDESLPLLSFLYAHACRPDFVYRHRWSPGDVVMWDNRCTIHYAVHDYGDAERTLHRIVIEG